MKIGFRVPSIKKRIAARTSWKRMVRNELGLKAPRGWGWLTNPKKAAYNRIYNRTTIGCGTILLIIAIVLVLSLSICLSAFARGGGHGGGHSSRSNSGDHARSYTHSGGSVGSSSSHRSLRSVSGVQRDSHGRIKRSSSAKHEFMKGTGYPNGRPGYVVDHVVPLKRGGADNPRNMQWQTKSDAKIKDKVE